MPQVSTELSVLLLLFLGDEQVSLTDADTTSTSLLEHHEYQTSHTYGIYSFHGQSSDVLLNNFHHQLKRQHDKLATQIIEEENLQKSKFKQ